MANVRPASFGSVIIPAGTTVLTGETAAGVAGHFNASALAPVIGSSTDTLADWNNSGRIDGDAVIWDSAAGDWVPGRRVQPHGSDAIPVLTLRCLTASQYAGITPNANTVYFVIAG